jgi:hypothetical protein
MNEGIFVRLSELAEQTDLIIRNLHKSIRSPKVKPLINTLNDNYSLLCKSIFQDCNDRPQEFRDIEYISYLTTKYGGLKKMYSALLLLSQSNENPKVLDNIQEGE